MKLSAQTLREMKSVSAISILTACTCPVARCLEKAGIPAILVGDTAGIVEMGFDSTRHCNARAHAISRRGGPPWRTPDARYRRFAIHILLPMASMLSGTQD